MKHFVALALFFLTVSVTAQVEHAPTVAQCQADQRLWLAKLEALPTDTGLPDFTTLSLWSSEMDNCQRVDPINRWLYYNVHGEISDVQAARMIRFLGRQGLYSKFIAEDADGKR